MGLDLGRRGFDCLLLVLRSPECRRSIAYVSAGEFRRSECYMRDHNRRVLR